MAAHLALGWSKAAPARPQHPLQLLATLAAAVLITAQTGLGLMEQARVDDEGVKAPAGSGSGGTSLLPGRETIVGAFSGAPYNYPSPARIKAGDAVDLTIDPIDWYTNPFKSPIYYGARVARWFGRSGAGVDFIHSKAIAPENQVTNFSGSIDGKPLPPQARIGDIFKKLEFSHGHNMLLFNGLLRLPSLGARVSPYVGAGAGVLLPHAEVGFREGERARTYEYNYAGPAAQALFGVEIRLARFSFFVEYKFTYADYEAPLSQVDGSWLPLDLWRQASRWFAAEQPAGGHITTKVLSHQVVSGLWVRIAPSP